MEVEDRRFGALRACSYFDCLRDDELRRLARSSRCRVYGRHELIAGGEHPERQIFLVMRGVIRAYWSGDEGRDLTIEEVFPGEVFGLLSLEEGEDACVGLEAVDMRTILLHVPCAALSGLLTTHPEMTPGLIREMARRRSALIHKLIGIACLPVRSRLAEDLAAEAEVRGNWTVRGRQDEIAARIGSTRGEVNRCLRDLCARGLVRRLPRRRGFQVMDLEGLKNLAERNSLDVR